MALGMRYITALGPDGRSRIARVDDLSEPDESPQAMDPEALRVAYPRWAEGERPDTRGVIQVDRLPLRLPTDGNDDVVGSRPGEHGVRISVTTYPPGWNGEMFWSNRVDVLLILSGTLTYVTDSGDKLLLRPGDTVVQNGTCKAFRNDGDEDAVMYAVMFGATHVGRTPPGDRYHGRPDEYQEILRRAIGAS